MYGSWDVKCKGQSFLSFCHFLPFDPPNNTQRIKILKKFKKTLEIIIILHKQTINDKSYDIWFLRYQLSSWSFFALLPINSLKNEYFKIMKKSPADIYHHFTLLQAISLQAILEGIIQEFNWGGGGGFYYIL